MRKIRNIDIILVIWCGSFGVYELFNIINKIGTFELHMTAFVIQLIFFTLAVKSIVEAVRYK